MNKEKIQKTNSELLQKTGIDFSRYRNPELTETISNAVTFPMFFVRTIRRPIGLLLLAMLVAIVAADHVLQKLILIFPGLVFAIINGFLIGLVMLIRRIRNDMGKVFMISSELSVQIVKDINAAKSTIKESAAIFPSLFEIFQGINTVVILPMVLQALEGRIPLVGKLVAGITERFFDLVAARLQPNMEATGEPAQQSIGRESPEQIMAWIQRVEQIMETAEKGMTEVVNKVSMVVAFPIMTVATLVFLVSAAILYGGYSLLG